MTRDTAKAVNATTRSKESVGTRYPTERANLLRAIQAKRGDRTLSDVVRYALDAVIEEHYPGAISREAA